MQRKFHGNCFCWNLFTETKKIWFWVAAGENLSLHEKWSFPLRVSSVNVTKSIVSCGFGHIYWSNQKYPYSNTAKSRGTFSNSSVRNLCKSRKIHCVKRVLIRTFSSPYFPAFGLNTERYGLSLRIQSKCGKIPTKKTPNTVTFHEVITN